MFLLLRLLLDFLKLDCLEVEECFLLELRLIWLIGLFLMAFLVEVDLYLIPGDLLLFLPAYSFTSKLFFVCSYLFLILYN